MAIYSAAVAAPAAFPAANAPSFMLPFIPTSLILVNEDPDTPANHIEFSFDGVTVHGKLIPTIIGGIRLTQKVQQIWVRATGGATPVVRVIAEQ